MGSYEFGIYVYVWTWVLLLGGVGEMGIGISSQRFIPEYAERGRLALLRGYVRGGRWIAAATGTAITILGIIGIELLEPWIDNYLVIPLFIGCFCLPFFALAGAQEGIARSYNWVNLGMLPHYILRPLLLIGLLGAAYAYGIAPTAKTAMTAAVVATWATAMMQTLILNRSFAAKVEPGPRAYAVGTWLSTSLPIFVVEFFYLLLTSVDVLVLQHFRPPDEVAVYYAAGKTLALVTFVYFSVAAAVAHKFSAYHAAGDRQRLAAFIADSVRWTFWPSLGAVALILLLGQPLLWLFGRGFVSGYYLMFILAIGLLTRASIGPAERLLNMLGEQRACAYVYAVAITFSLCLNLLLIPRFGAAGAAVATSTALVIETILLFVVTKRRLGLHVFIWGGGSQARVGSASQ
jgi:O-antigen/teichoic acid export membrane protein